MYKLISLLFIIAVFHCPCFSKTIELQLINSDVLFFDSSEDEMETEEKTRLSQLDFKEFFIEIIAVELKAAQIPWASSSGENISDIFHKILNTFKYEEFIYYKKYQFEDDDN